MVEATLEKKEEAQDAEPETFDEEIEIMGAILGENIRVYDDKSMRIEINFSEVKSAILHFRFL